MVWLTDAATPHGMRLYAIGDVHGCLDQLLAVHAWIDEDLARNPPDAYRIIHLGDYVDRGPDSRGVLDHLAGLMADNENVLCLMGNHDLMLAAATRADQRMLGIWLNNGGVETLASYELSVETFLQVLEPDGSALPPAMIKHVGMIGEMPTCLRFGDYVFVHAGIDPSAPIQGQSEDDLLWIRDRFLEDAREYDGIIVHGHTPVRRVDVRPNRIGIDTGAVYGGTLSCVVLDGTAKARLGPGGRLPLIG